MSKRSQIRESARELGSRGGKASWANMTKEERSKRAKVAARASVLARAKARENNS